MTISPPANFQRWKSARGRKNNSPPLFKIRLPHYNSSPPITISPLTEKLGNKMTPRIFTGKTPLPCNTLITCIFLYLYTCICTSLSRLFICRYCRLFLFIFTSFYSFFVFQFVFVFYIHVLPECRINILYRSLPGWKSRPLRHWGYYRKDYSPHDYCIRHNNNGTCCCNINGYIAERLGRSRPNLAYVRCSAMST